VTDTALASFYDGNWDLEPNELAALFALKEWPYGSSKEGVSPTAEQIRQLLSELVAEVSADGRPGVVANRGRLLAMKHSELDSSIDVYLNIGFVWDRAKMDEDEFDELQEYGLLDNGEEYDSE
jgi:hypothetical protein